LREVEDESHLSDRDVTDARRRAARRAISQLVSTVRPLISLNATPRDSTAHAQARVISVALAALSFRGALMKENFYFYFLV